MRRWCVCFEVITPTDLGPESKEIFRKIRMKRRSIMKFMIIARFKDSFYALPPKKQGEAHGRNRTVHLKVDKRRQAQGGLLPRQHEGDDGITGSENTRRSGTPCVRVSPIPLRECGAHPPCGHGCGEEGTGEEIAGECGATPNGEARCRTERHNWSSQPG